MTQLNLREVTDLDFDWLYELTKLSYREVVIRQFGEWRDDDEKEKVKSKWAHGSGNIIQQGSTRIGAFLIEKWLDYDLLREIQIEPDFRNQGIGSYYINRIIDQSRVGNRPLRLRVLFENTKAKRLYERLGFITLKKLDNQYLMEATLKAIR